MINEQISASRNIKNNFGIEKALGYIIGEKFYFLVEEYLENQKNDNEKHLYALVTKFAEKITTTFSKEAIKQFFASNPRFGPLGHVATEDEHELFVEAGAVKHSIDKEIKDALIAGEMKKYLQTSL